MAKLTITLPVYNGMPYLKDAVESILAQTYDNFRFLIIDDGSRDGSTEYLKSIKDPRVDLIVRENRGLGATLNQLFAESETEYVVRMDSDDKCAPDRLTRIRAFIESNDDFVMAGSDQAFLVGTKTLKAAPRPTDHESIRRLLLKKRPGILHPTVVVRRDAWERIGGYRLSGAGEDLDFCLRMCDIGRVTNIPEVLYYYRLHATSLSNSRRREINYGYDYGIACALARKRGEIEPDPESYRQRWNSRSIPLRVAETFGNLGQYLYRLSLVRGLEGRRLTSIAFMVLAASVQPRTTTDRLVQIAARAVRQRDPKIPSRFTKVIHGAKSD
ncbi:MAG: glycosyltransferase family A protein [Terracidiphilus sp.]